MTRSIDYYFTPQSPWTYLGHARFAALAKAAGATVRVRPVDFGAVFPVSGGLPLGKRAPQRQAYRLVDLARFSRHLDIPLNPKPKFFPVAGDDAAKLIIAVDLHDGTEAAMKLCGAVFAAVWVKERNIADPKVLEALAAECGLAGQAHRAVAKPDRAGALRGLHAAGHRRQGIRRAELRDRRRDLLGPGSAGFRRTRIERALKQQPLSPTGA